MRNKTHYYFKIRSGGSVLLLNAWRGTGEQGGSEERFGIGSRHPNPSHFVQLLGTKHKLLQAAENVVFQVFKRIYLRCPIKVYGRKKAV